MSWRILWRFLTGLCGNFWDFSGFEGCPQRISAFLQDSSVTLGIFKRIFQDSLNNLGDISGSFMILGDAERIASHS